MLTVKDGVKTMLVLSVLSVDVPDSYAMNTAPDGVLPLKENEADAWLVVPLTCV